MISDKSNENQKWLGINDIDRSDNIISNDSKVQENLAFPVEDFNDSTEEINCEEKSWSNNVATNNDNSNWINGQNTPKITKDDHPVIQISNTIKVHIIGYTIKSFIASFGRYVE